jgi:EAL domain-containing protein (putative c-di-GMP-specific phosphodiesterase class I)
MGRWVIQQACRQNAAWQRVGLPPLRMAVNVSALQFAQAEFVRIVAEALKETGLDPRWLQIELTESMLMRNTEEAAARLREVRGLGVAIALDDFGTGYSSLAYLQRLPIDTLKIDRSFVAEIGADALDHPAGADTAVIRAIASLGRSLGMHVVAEGVETAGQRDFLRRIECDGMQGYLFGKALPVEEFEAMLRAAPRLCADARAA